MPVVDANGKLVGVIAQRDMLDIYLTVNSSIRK